jgi:predicted GIY-YIG superfamily endonuclease
MGHWQSRLCKKLNATRYQQHEDARLGLFIQEAKEEALVEQIECARRKLVVTREEIKKQRLELMRQLAKERIGPVRTQMAKVKRKAGGLGADMDDEQSEA